MKTHNTTPDDFRASNALILLCLLSLILPTLRIGAQTAPPPADWKTISWYPNNVDDSQSVPQTDSGDDWWFSHKNLYDASGKQIGYIACGYVSSIPHPGDEAKARNVFNECTSCPYNLYPSSGSLFPGSIGGNCDDFLDANTQGHTEYMGLLARLDLQGKIQWAHRPNICGDGLQELVQSGNCIFAIGHHYGVKNTDFANNNANRAYLSYNPVSATTKTSNILSGVSTPTNVSHMYVTKYTLEGNKKWESLYGAVDYSAGASSAWTALSEGWDLIVNSTDGYLYAVGKAQAAPGATVQQVFVAKIDTANGYMVASTLIPLPSNQVNSNGNNAQYMLGRSICEMTGVTGTMTPGSMVIGCQEEFGGSNTLDGSRGCVYSILPNLGFNPGWPNNPPISFSASTGAAKISSLYEVNYRPIFSGTTITGGYVLAAAVNNCDACGATGNNSAEGFIYRLDQTNGGPLAGGNASCSIGQTMAYDMRIGVTPTSDGGFAVVAARRNINPAPTVTLSSLGTFSTCAAFTAADCFNSTSPSATHTFQIWDTDPLIVKFNSSGNEEWEWSEDITPGRGRDMAVDFKREECMYKITEAWDGGLVISGNSSTYHDDCYMVKLFSKCADTQTFDISSSWTVTPGQNFSITTPTSIKGNLVITSGASVTVTGPSGKLIMGGRALGPSNILVMKGGTLTVNNGGEITSLDNNTCPNSMWEGITLLGTASQPQTSAAVVTSSQGLVIINSGTISNAVTGITTGSYVPGVGNFDYQSSGGVIRASDAWFINNGRDVQYMYYHNPQNPTSNAGYFYNSHFLVNNELNDRSVPVGRVSMYEVLGVRFKGCEFANNAGSVYGPADKGYGVQSVNAYYKIEDYCPTGACATYTQSQFTDLTRGVWIMNGGSIRTVNVDHAIFANTFTNSTGVRAAGVELSAAPTTQITRNSFSMSDYSTHAVYINDTKNFNVSSNTVTASGPSSGVGVYAANSGGGTHKIYRNTFDGLNYGVIAIGPNSAYNTNGSNTAPNDGLRINCATFTNTNSYDIIMQYAPVAENQGVLFPFNSPNAKNLVRNRYAASCGGSAKWFVFGNSKTMYHAANSDAVCQPTPQPSCSSTLLTVSNSSLTFNFNTDCPEDETGATTNTASPSPNPNVIGTVLSGTRALVSSLQSAYSATLDGGDTGALLSEIASNANSGPVKSLLLGYSPYLSDTVLKAYFSSTVVSFGNVKDLHDANKPVTAEVWQTIMDRGFVPDDMATLEDQQDDQPVSPRRAMEDELGRAKSELQFIYAQKLNYFLGDTLPGAMDTVIAVLWADNGNALPDAKVRLVEAYATVGAYTRAFAYADSMAAVPEYSLVMGLEQALLELDTAQRKYNKIEVDDNLRNTIETFATDTTLPGCWRARAVLNFVYGRDMQLQYLNMPQERQANGSEGQDPQMDDFTGSETKQKTLLNSRLPDRLSVFPNPSGGSFSLLYNSGKGANVQYSIRDVLGREAAAGSLEANQAREIDGQQLNNGIYFITLVQDGKTLNKQKIIIMK